MKSLAKNYLGWMLAATAVGFLGKQYEVAVALVILGPILSTLDEKLANAHARINELNKQRELMELTLRVKLGIEIPKGD